MNQWFDNQHRSPADGMTDAEWHFRQHMDGTCRCDKLPAKEYTKDTMLCDRCKRKLDEQGQCLTCDKHALIATTPNVEWWLARLRYQHQLYLTYEQQVNPLGITLIKHALYSTYCDICAEAERTGDDTALEQAQVILKSRVLAK